MKLKKSLFYVIEYAIEVLLFLFFVWLGDKLDFTKLQLVLYYVAVIFAYFIINRLLDKLTDKIARNKIKKEQDNKNDR